MHISNSSTAGFALEPHGLDLVFRRARLASRQWLSPAYVRVRLSGDELLGFTSPGADDHIRVFFPTDAAASISELREAPSREYTPLAWDSHAGWLDLEFAIHGTSGVTQGIGARWAASAPIGSHVGVGGPRGSKVLVGHPDSWFLAGDETAIPAIRRYVQHMRPAATGSILIEVADPEHEVTLKVPTGVDLEYVHRGSALAGSALAARFAEVLERPAGSVFGFIAAEQSIVKPGRALLLDRWQIPTDQVIIKGYWKRGEAEYHAPH